MGILYNRWLSLWKPEKKSLKMIFLKVQIHFRILKRKSQKKARNSFVWKMKSLSKSLDFILRNMILHRLLIIKKNWQRFARFKRISSKRKRPFWVIQNGQLIIVKLRARRWYLIPRSFSYVLLTLSVMI